MASAAETALAALHTRLLSIPGVTVERNAAVPTAASAGGLIILRDGSPGEPEVTMSPLAYEYWHRAEIELYVQKSNGRDARFDAVKMAIGAALEADRTLSGVCNWVEAEAPEPSEISDPGAVPIKAATIVVTLVYLTLSPLG